MQPLLFLREEAPAEVEGRTLVVRLLTYNKVYETGEGKERIKPGAFKSPLARPGGLIRFRHIGERPDDLDSPDYIYGPVLALREEGDALYAEGQVVESPRGDHLLELVKSGATSGVSMSSLVSGWHMSGNVRDVTRVANFNGFSVTPKPAYTDAAVMALREKVRDEAAIKAALAENARYRVDVHPLRNR